MPYPTASDFRAFLAHAGIVAGGDLNHQQAIDAAIDWWEDYTQWHPFLSGTAEASKRYDPPEGYFLDLGRSNGPGGYVSISAVAYSVIGASGAGSPMTEWTDYYLHYHRNRTTIIGLDFQNRQSGDRRTIKVTGIEGFCSTLPDDVFQAILRHAAAESQPQLAIWVTATDSQTPGLQSWREGDVQETYGDNPMSAQGLLWRKQADMTANRYRRARFGSDWRPGQV